MAKVKISEYSTTNSSNTDINSINIDEGCAPSGINNAIREVMVHLKNWQTNASGDGATFASLVVQGTGSFTGAVTMSAGATLSGTNTLSGATVMAASLGTSASPSIYFTSDTDTGLFSPTADTVGVATDGSERMRVDSSGNVGIGETTPLSYGKLVVTQTTGSTIYATADVGYAILDAATNSSGSRFNIAGGNSTNGVTLWGYNSTRTGYTPINYGASEHIFKVDTTEKARLNTSGNLALASNLGIGGATPTTSGSGITFPATQSASTNANTLDDYEEGTWTPNQGAGLTVTGAYSSVGRYVKIGRIVYVEATQTGATNIAVASGTVLCTNLPFTPTTGGASGSGNLTNDNLDKTSSCWVDPNNSTIYAIEAVTTNPKLWWAATYYAST